MRLPCYFRADVLERKVLSAPETSLNRGLFSLMEEIIFMKILICDYLGIAEQWINRFVIKENLEIVGIISPVDKSQRSLLMENSWDYLLIFEEGMREDFNKLTQLLKLSPQRVIYAQDWESWAEHPAATFALINPVQLGLIYRSVIFNFARKFNYFISSTTEDNLHYVATSKDDVIIKNMYLTRQNWSKDEMELFYLLAQKFYNVDDSNGYFLDLGANIGTTGIYFTKILAPKLKLLAFEPDKENFKLLKVNLILNDVEDVIAENYGLGDKESEMTFYRDKENPGHNGIFSSDTGKETETIKIIPLDKYLTENKISPEDVKYIWIDAEGFEPQILSGAEKLLSENQAPIFLEFNPYIWKKSGYYEKFMQLLTKFYEGYIWIHEVLLKNKMAVYPIEKLWEFQNSNAWIGSLGDILLIHKL